MTRKKLRFEGLESRILLTVDAVNRIPGDANKRQDFSHWNANEKSLLAGALRRGRRSVEVEFGMEAGLRLMGAMLRLA
jgi:hypothetical protein